MNKKHILLSASILICLILCFIIYSVFFAEQIDMMKSLASTESSSQNLYIDVTIDKKAGTTIIPLDQPSEGCTEIVYRGLSDVTISIDGTSLKLEDAIREKYISIDQIISAARMDATTGFCKEIAKSQNSLTKFVYQYPDFDLIYIHDIYETPTGQHLISEFSVYASGIYQFSSTNQNTYRNESTGKPIDYEYWGLNFTVTEADSSGITIECTQSKGQQIGDLVTDFFSVVQRSIDDSGKITETRVKNGSAETVPSFLINMDDTTEISIDFSSMYGELPAGDYAVYFLIRDEYNKDTVHPLMRNYYDQQLFDVPFTIE